jgi:hypothetical protein
MIVYIYGKFSLLFLVFWQILCSQHCIHVVGSYILLLLLFFKFLLLYLSRRQSIFYANFLVFFTTTYYFYVYCNTKKNSSSYVLLSYPCRRVRDSIGTCPTICFPFGKLFSLFFFIIIYKSAAPSNVR